LEAQKELGKLRMKWLNLVKYLEAFVTCFKISIISPEKEDEKAIPAAVLKPRKIPCNPWFVLGRVTPEQV
jgi:hypothetical protein